jgi:hypothetical protein
MTFTHPSAASIVAFLLIVLGVAACLIAGVHFASRRLGEPAGRAVTRVAIGFLIWQSLISAAVLSGVIREHPMPGVLLFFAAANLAGLAFALSPIGRKLALGLPLATLVAFQAFRFPLELVLHSWAKQGTIPSTMTWTGQNLDILTGAAALCAAPLSTRSRWIAWGFNALGLLLLLNVGRVAMMSSPLPFAWGVEPPLQLALHLPYAWIGSVCVAGALAGHVILTRALLSKPGPGA